MSDDRYDHYLVAKGARDIALVRHLSDCFTERIPGCWRVHWYGLNQGGPPYCIFSPDSPQGLEKAHAMMVAWANRDERAIGTLLGYAPSLVEEFVALHCEGKLESLTR